MFWLDLHNARTSRLVLGRDARTLLLREIRNLQSSGLSALDLGPGDFSLADVGRGLIDLLLLLRDPVEAVESPVTPLVMCPEG